MKKKIVILIFIFLLLGIILVGSTQIVAQDSTRLNLSQVVEIALTNNLEFQKAGYQSKNAEIDAKKNEAKIG